MLLEAEQADRSGKDAFVRRAAGLFSTQKNSARCFHPVSKNPAKIEACSNCGWFFAARVQRTECPRADAEWNPKCDGAIGERDNDRLTPIHVEGCERDGHETFNNANARWRGRYDQEKISNGKSCDDGAR